MTAPHKNGNLPKHLVNRFGEDTIRRVVGLPHISDKVLRMRQERQCNQ